jgi:hypothetical protein
VRFRCQIADCRLQMQCCARVLVCVAAATSLPADASPVRPEASHGARKAKGTAPCRETHELLWLVGFRSATLRTKNQGGTALAPLPPSAWHFECASSRQPSSRRASPNPAVAPPLLPHSTFALGKRVLQVLQPDLIGARPCRATNKALIMSHSSCAQKRDPAFQLISTPIHPHSQSYSRPLPDQQRLQSIHSHPPVC